MRIFCPATLSVLFLPRFVAPDQAGNHLVCTVPQGNGDREQHWNTHCEPGSPDPLPLFICHCSPVHAVGRVAQSLIPRRRSSGLRHRKERDRMHSYERTLVLLPSCFVAATNPRADQRLSRFPDPSRETTHGPVKATRPVCRSPRESSTRRPSWSRSPGNRAPVTPPGSSRACATAPPRRRCWWDRALAPAAPSPPREHERSPVRVPVRHAKSVLLLALPGRSR